MRILADSFTGTGNFDLSNRDDTGSIAALSPEATASAKLVDIGGLSASARSGGTGPAAGQDFLRATNSQHGVIDLKAVPFQGSSIADLKTERSSVAEYFAGRVEAISRANDCLATMYAPEAELITMVTANVEHGMVFVEDFATDRPNVLNYEDIAGQTIKMDRAAGYTPTDQAPLIIRVAPGTTSIGQLRFEGWSAGSQAQ